jgi:hypothetical protein
VTKYLVADGLSSRDVESDVVCGHHPERTAVVHVRTIPILHSPSPTPVAGPKAHVCVRVQSFRFDTTATTGSITSTREEKRQLAQASLGFNMKNPTFRKLFPDWVEEHSRRQAAAAEVRRAFPTWCSEADRCHLSNRRRAVCSGTSNASGVPASRS